jgi:diadenosine tetraphosphate (Ap4A) HIT family hydrolase
MSDPATPDARLSGLIPDPRRSCFLCRPEDWRIVFRTERVQVVAGLGPLREGHVLVAPVAHVSAVANLDEDTFLEFLVTCELVRASLADKYGPGYTAYERGRFVTESGTPLHTNTNFCYHAHRNIVPGRSDCFDAISGYFARRMSLTAAEDVKLLGTASRARDYIYYETGSDSTDCQRVGFLEPSEIPNQFMRRLVASDWLLERAPEWNADLDYATLINTTAALRGEFVGITETVEVTRSESSVLQSLKNGIAIEGLALVGRHALAALIGRTSAAKIIDMETLAARLPVDMDTSVATEQILANVLDASSAASDQSMRSEAELPTPWRGVTLHDSHRTILASALDRLGPCIVVGQGAWDLAGEKPLRILLEADFSTRVKRRLFTLARHQRRLSTLSEVSSELRRTDDGRFPLRQEHCSRIDNSRRPLSAVMREVMQLS